MSAFKQIGDHKLQFDIGALTFMSEVNETDPLNPLEGVTELMKQAAIIFYGASARVDESNQMPVQKTHAECVDIIKSFNISDIINLAKWYTPILQIEDMPTTDQPAKEDEKKS